MAPKKGSNKNPKSEEKSAAMISSSYTKRDTVSSGTKLYATVTFQPARGTAGVITRKSKKMKNFTHNIYFYLMDKHEDCHSVAVIIGGGGEIHGGSWLQKAMDDMVRGEDDLFPLSFFDGTFYLCHDNGERRLNDEGL